MTFSFSFFGFSDWKSVLAWPKGEDRSSDQKTVLDHKNNQLEREFLRDVLRDNPEALQSELGVMALMSQYPRHF